MRSISALCAALAVVGCVSKGTDIPPVTAGTGVTIDPKTQTVSVDSSKVPTLPSCAPKQVVTMSADGTWSCASAAADSQKLNGLTADNYAAATNGVAANSAELNGLPASSYQERDPATGNVSVNGSLAVGANGSVGGDLSVGGRTIISHQFSYNCRIIGLVTPAPNAIILPQCTETVSETVEGTYCGETAAVAGLVQANDPVSGNSTTGYRSAKILCEAVTSCGAGAHVCRGTELVRSLGMNINPSSGWYASGTPNDCNGFGSNLATATGSTWVAGPSGFGSTQACSNVSPIKCCR